MSMKCKSLTLLCRTTYTTSNYSEAEILCNKALKLLEEARAAGLSDDGFDYALLRADVQNTLGDVYRVTYRPFECLQAYTSDLTLFEERGLTAESSTVFSLMSSAHADQGLLEKALETAQRAVTTGGESLVTMSHLGSALSISGRFEEALACYRNRLTLTNQKCGLRSEPSAMAHLYIDTCFKELRKSDESLKPLRQAHSIFNELESEGRITEPGMQANVLREVAVSLQHRPAEAIVLVERALAIFRRIYSADNEIVSRSLMLLAELNSALGNVDAAERASAEATTASRRSQTQCAAAGCPRKMKDDGSSLEMCAGCRRTFYCSVACQRADWKAVHKTECKQLQQQLSVASIAPSGTVASRPTSSSSSVSESESTAKA